MFNAEQRADIGYLVFTAYIAQKPPKEKVNKMDCEAPNGPVKVVSYPKYFIPEVDRIIHQYRQTLADKAWEKLKEKFEDSEIELPTSDKKISKPITEKPAKQLHAPPTSEPQKKSLRKRIPVKKPIYQSKYPNS